MTPDKQPAFWFKPGSEQAKQLENEIMAEIKRLTVFSNRGLWALLLFTAVSIFAWQGFSFIVIPESYAAFLGAPPPANIISIALLVYTFSAMILSLSRMMSGIEHKSSFCHVGYLTGFFLFYHFAKALDDNFWVVFGAGVTIITVEMYRIWSFAKLAIIRKEEQLEYVKRTGRTPLED